jgi:plasmid replication initiation protein
LSEADELEIRAVDYAEMFDVPKNKAYEQTREASQTLFQRYVILYGTDPKTGKEDKLTVRWVSSVRYVDGSGTLYLQFAQKIVPYITRLEKEFTRYKLEKVANMSSPYAIRLYELLIQWGSVGYREIELEQLRKILMVVDEYKAIKDFKKRVIDVALSQINEFSDLTASYTQRKTGRVVTHLIFRFSQKEEPKPDPKQAEKSNFDKSTATKEQQAVEFLTNCKAFKRRYPDIAPHIAWRTPAIWGEFAGAFEEWASE